MEEVVLKQAELYLSGMSYREIAEVYKVSHITIRNNLVNRLRDIDSILYDKVMDQIEKNTEKNVRDENVQKRVLASYKLLVEKDMNIKKIAREFDVNEYVTYRDVTKRLRDLNKIAPEIVTEEMLNTAQEVLNRHSNTNIIKKEPINIMQLFNMFPKKEKRMLFLTKCALTFGLRLDSLSLVLKMDKEKLKQDILCNNPFYASLKKLFDYGIKRQDIAIENFEDYYRKLCKAYMEKDATRQKELLSIISDKDAKDLIEERKQKKKVLKNEQILIILKYQIKYMLPSDSIADLFGIRKNYYKERVENLGEEYYYLIADFAFLEDRYEWIEKVENNTRGIMGR